MGKQMQILWNTHSRRIFSMSVLGISAHVENIRFVYIRAMKYFRLSAVVCSENNFFIRKRKKSQKGDAFLSLFFLSRHVSFTGIRGETQCLKALPVIFRGMSAYLYWPRFRFYIASHRYAPRETALARDSLTISARLIFTKLAPSLKYVSHVHACVVLLSPSFLKSYVV